MATNIPPHNLGELIDAVMGDVHLENVYQKALSLQANYFHSIGGKS